MVRVVIIVAATLALVPLAVWVWRFIGMDRERETLRPLPDYSGALIGNPPEAQPFVSAPDSLIYEPVICLVAFANIFERPSKHTGQWAPFVSHLEHEIRRVSDFPVYKFRPHVCHRVHQPLAVLLEDPEKDTVVNVDHIDNASRFLRALLDAFAKVKAGDATKWDDPGWCLAYYVLRTTNNHLRRLNGSADRREAKRALLQSVVGRSLGLLNRHAEMPRFVRESLIENVWPVADVDQDNWDRWDVDVLIAHEQVVELENLPAGLQLRALGAQLASIASHALIASSDEALMKDQGNRLRFHFLAAAQELCDADQSQVDHTDVEWVKVQISAPHANAQRAADEIDSVSEAQGAKRCRPVVEQLIRVGLLSEMREPTPTGKLAEAREAPGREPGEKRKTE